MLIATFSSVSISTIIGYGILTIGIVATALSSQRYLLMYALAGMLYWLVIEGIHNVLLFALPLSSWHGYVAAMALSWLPLFGWVIHRALAHSHITEELLSIKKLRPKSAPAAQHSQYIEHTPVYEHYQPRFH